MAASRTGSQDQTDGRTCVAGVPARVLRRRRAGRRDRRAGARAPRAAGLRPQADRPQRARRPRPRGARRDLRRERGEVPRGRRDRPLGARRRAGGRTNARGARARTIDATCPLVTKVHAEARRYAAEGYTILLIGHAGHEEVEGTLGEAPEATVLVQSVEDAEALEVSDPDARRLRHADDALGRRDRRDRRGAPPAVPGRSRAPKRDDICYATTNRQRAVKEHARRGRPPARDRLAEQLELEPARRDRPRRRRRRPPDRRRDRDRRGAGSTARETVGLTSGASAPEQLVERVCDWFRARGVEEIGRSSRCSRTSSSGCRSRFAARSRSPDSG